jgi:predicted ribosome quality control (RQC) complex YloA/Tae2 family protein
MSLSDAEIASVVAELAPVLLGSAAGKVYLRDEVTLVVELGRARLLLAAHPRASRLHLERDKPAASGPAPPFAMLLRKRLGGQRLASLAPLSPGERVLELRFAPGGERLVAELTGPHANLFLVGPDGTVGGALRRSGSTTRALAPGHAYVPPPPAPAGARWRGQQRFGAPPGVEARVAAHYETFLADLERQALRERAAAALRREIERLGRLERGLTEDLARVTEAAGLRKLGDLLLAHAHELPGRGAASVTVPDDFEDGAPLTIPIDPALDARQNAARFYRQHKRLTAGRKHVDARLLATRAARAAAEDQLAAIASLGADALRALAPAATPRATPARRRAAAAPRLPYREYQSAASDVIWVGRGASDNDALTFRHARGGDLWLHCRDAAGAHVVVPRRTSAPLKDETFLDAATLAAHFSPLGGEAQVDVMVTHVKNLRKPKGAPPGRVFTSDTRTHRVRMEPARVARLLSRAGVDENQG